MIYLEIPYGEDPGDDLCGLRVEDDPSGAPSAWVKLVLVDKDGNLTNPVSFTLDEAGRIADALYQFRLRHQLKIEA